MRNWKSLLTFLLGCGLLLGQSHALAAPNYPWGSKLEPYPYGNPITGNTSGAVTLKYWSWKGARMKNAPDGFGGYIIENGSGGGTYSEGMGYGMLISVVIAGHDAAAQANFNKLLTTVRAHPATGLGRPDQDPQLAQHVPYLMAYKVNPDGQSDGAPNDSWPAMDGDLDIALALLMAHRQWGSAGSVDYLTEALHRIDAIKAWFTYPDGRLKANQNGLSNVIRTSDMMFGHFRAFSKAMLNAGRSQDAAFWNLVISKQLDILEAIVAQYSPDRGLQPDFIHSTNLTPPLLGLKDSYTIGQTCASLYGDGQFSDTWLWANAERNPWRFASDYVLSGDIRVRNILVRMMNFFISDIQANADHPGDISYTRIGFSMTYPDHACLPRGGPDLGYWARAIIGPQLAGALVDAAFQSHRDAVWNWIHDGTNYPNMGLHWTPNYYDAELMLLPLIVATGNWWAP